ncbi:DUF3307 domain-containing protein [Anoxybacterium hadale]|uniref:DUF3307 domain-containing protein n=1 Tax=Anoxybacterium hadale TaxID=3408580 RepID=A0ACD1ABM1_9FIRM|nr:DUF3307 domain-containing protein [Clostridiales bacterium]
MEEVNSEKYEFLYNAISDTQETIRFTDTKSGAIIIIVMGFIAGLISLADEYYNYLSKLTGLSKDILIAGATGFIVFLIISLLISLKSINPSNSPIDHIKTEDLKEHSSLPNLKYYISGLCPSMRWEDYFWELKGSKLKISLGEYLKEINESNGQDFIKVLTLELLKLSYIKEKKIQRSKMAITSLGLSILFAALTIVMVILINNSKVAIPWNNALINLDLFLYLIIGHVIGDYVLQTSWQIEKKRTSWGALLTHLIIYTIVIYVLSFFAGRITLLSISIIILTHLILDKFNLISKTIELVTKKECNSIKINFICDQGVHIMILFLIAMFN